MFKHLNITCQKGETSDPQTILRSWTSREWEWRQGECKSSGQQTNLNVSDDKDKENANFLVNKQLWVRESFRISRWLAKKTTPVFSERSKHDRTRIDVNGDYKTR